MIHLLIVNLGIRPKQKLEQNDRQLQPCRLVCQVKRKTNQHRRRRSGKDFWPIL
jgi:hypothetical protein